jgi:hypothetical protein
MIEKTGRVASEVVASLKDRPLALALVIVNVLFLAITAWVLFSVKESGERRDKLVSDLVANCRPTLQPQQR